GRAPRKEGPARRAASAGVRPPRWGARRTAPITLNGLMAERTELPRVSLEPDPVIEAYKKDVDRTLIRENLKLTPDERIKKMVAVLRFAEEVRRAKATR